MDQPEIDPVLEANEALAASNGHIPEPEPDVPKSPPEGRADYAGARLNAQAEEIDALQKQQKLLVLNFLLLTAAVGGLVYAVKKGAAPSGGVALP